MKIVSRFSCFQINLWNLHHIIYTAFIFPHRTVISPLFSAPRCSHQIEKWNWSATRKHERSPIIYVTLGCPALWIEAHHAYLDIISPPDSWSSRRRRSRGRRNLIKRHFVLVNHHRVSSIIIWGICCMPEDVGLLLWVMTGQICRSMFVSPLFETSSPWFFVFPGSLL